MANCKDCICYEPCGKQNKLVQVDSHTWDEFTELDDVENYCPHFKNKASFQEIKKGEWLPDYEIFTDWNGYESEPMQTGWVCSVCGRQESRKESYCHCGALMSNNCEDEKKGENNVRV